MATHGVLLLDALGLRAYRRQAGTMKLDGEFAADASGHDAFAGYLARHRGCVFHFLVNVAEEGFHLEDIPRLRGRDRQVVIQRKLRQAFAATPFGCALPLGYAAEGRRDERMLLMSLTRPQLVEPWLEILESAEALLADLLSLPQVLANLAVVRTQPRCLLVSGTRGGLCQSFFDNGRLRFSRLTPWSNDAPAATAATYMSEAAKLQQYLVGQRLVARDAVLPVIVVPPRPCTWREQLHDSTTLRFECLDSVAVGDDDACYAQLLLQGRARQQFAPAATRRAYRRWQVKRALSGVSAAICAACLLFAAFQLSIALGHGEDTANQRARNEAVFRSLQETSAAQAPTPLAVPRLRELAARYDELRQGSPGPAPLLRRLAAALNEFPQIELERLHWSSGNRYAGDPVGRFAAVDIEARLPAETANDPRGQIAVVNAFSEMLRTDPALQVRIAGPAFDAAAGKLMRGGDTETLAPQFSLSLALRQ